MFDIFFGWRKASKCKKQIKQLRSRLKLLKNKRCSIVRHLREDVAELIKLGYEDKAFNRADQLFKDESTVTVYELLDNFCQSISTNLSYIRKNKDCPNDINEAVSSLIFASSRCGDLPELRVIRELFGERYGQRFAITASELLPGNLVNHQIVERLSITSVPDDVKYLLVNEIAKDCCLQPEILAIEFASEQQQVQSENLNLSEDKTLVEGSNASNKEHIQATNSSLTSKTESTGLKHRHKSLDAVSTSISSSIVHQSSLDSLESPPHNNSGKLENSSLFNSSYSFRVPSGDSSESLWQYPEEKIVYLDDVEEIQSSVSRSKDFQDQRLFMFKFKQSVSKHETETSERGFIEDDTYTVEDDESWSEISSSRSSRKSKKSYKKKSRRRRSMSRETNPSINDIECEIYYEKPRKSNSTRKNRKQKSTLGVEEKKLVTKLFLKNPKVGDMMKNCSLENPFHCCLSDGKRENEAKSCKKNLGRRSCDNSATVYDIFTYPYGKRENPEGKEKGFTASDSLTGKKPAGPSYLTVKSMPPERSKENQTSNNFQRWNSFPFQNPEYVHPKLPNYDDITAKFMALKRERLQGKH